MDSSSLLPHLLEEDNREPIFRFTVPQILTNLVGITKGDEEASESSIQLGVLGISLPYWIELLGLVILSLSTAALVGLVLYKTVVEPQKTNTLQAYLIGWGLVLPFWVSFPYLLLQCFDLRNAIFRFLMGGIAPIICFFRTTETIYGFCPPYVTKSLKDFLFYYATIPKVARVPKTGAPIPCSNAKKAKHLLTFLGLLALTGLLQSILTPHPHMNVFGTGLELESELESSDDVASWWYSTQRYATWQLYANSALQALLFQMYLTTYYEALELAFALVTGYEAERGMKNPLLESTKPTEFWGKRWNTMVHAVLKNGVYKLLRIRAGVHRIGAILGTFVASGVFHEWILVLAFVKDNAWIHIPTDRHTSYTPTFGGATVFFAWQALLIGTELMVGDTAWVQSIASKLPRCVKTALVVGGGVPLAHFFLEPYVASGFFFQHGATGLPMLIRVA